MEGSITVTLVDHKTNRTVDLSVRSDLTALELFRGLNKAYGWGHEEDNIPEAYLAAENPIALLRGSRTLEEFGIRDGSVIHYVRH